MKPDFLMVKERPETRTYPMRVELAGYYCEDVWDFLRGYRMAFYAKEGSFQAVKSRRAKAYVDLRMALEALLKAIVCLRGPYGLCGRPLVQAIRRHSHDTQSLVKVALTRIAIADCYVEAIDKCAGAPVDLRYQFDAMNFRCPDDRTYCETIGSDAWLKTLEDFVDIGLARVQKALTRRSKMVPGSVVAAELNRPRDY